MSTATDISIRRPFWHDRSEVEKAAFRRKIIEAAYEQNDASWTMNCPRCDKQVSCWRVPAGVDMGPDGDDPDPYEAHIRVSGCSRCWLLAHFGIYLD